MIVMPASLGLVRNAGGDPFAANTVLLMHFDGVNGSTTFTDVKGKAITPFGNAQISTAQSRFGGASGHFDGAEDYISSPFHSDFVFSSGPFTVELFVRFSALGADRALISYFYSGLLGWVVRYVNGTGLRIVLNSTGHNFAWSPVVNTWYHVAVCRDGSGALRVFVDGSQIGSVTDAQSIGSNASQIFRIGRTPTLTDDLNGFVDEARVTRAARYTANFTPPSAPFPDS